MAYYRRIEIVNGETAEPAQWVAVHPFRWGHIMVSTDPDAAFVEDETIAARLVAAEALAEAVRELSAEIVRICDVSGEYVPGLANVRYRLSKALTTWESPSENEEA